MLFVCQLLMLTVYVVCVPVVDADCLFCVPVVDVDC